MSYKLLTYRADHGRVRAGVLVGDQVFDVAMLTGIAAYATVLDVLNDWDSARPLLKKAAEKVANENIAGTPLKQVELLAPLPHPGTVFCAGANYADHIQEMLGAMKMPSDTDPRSVIGEQPWHFIKTSRSVMAPGSSVPMPSHSGKVDWEAELVAVIGRTAKNVTLEQALDYVAGYTIANDLSARDLVKRTSVPESSPFRWDWVGQKCFDGALPIGPWITPADEIPDPQQLAIKLWVNDNIKQDSQTSKMIFSLAEQIVHLSSQITLQPGDLIATGTPAGVGVARPEFLKAGDTVRIFIEKIGELSHTLV